MEQFTLLATLSSDSIHGNYRCNSIYVCVLLRFSLSLALPLPLSHFKFALNTFLGKGFSFINGVCPGDKQGASCISISAKTMLSL